MLFLISQAQLATCLVVGILCAIAFYFGYAYFFYHSKNKEVLAENDSLKENLKDVQYEHNRVANQLSVVEKELSSTQKDFADCRYQLQQRTDALTNAEKLYLNSISTITIEKGKINTILKEIKERYFYVRNLSECLYGKLAILAKDREEQITNGVKTAILFCKNDKLYINKPKDESKLITMKSVSFTEELYNKILDSITPALMGQEAFNVINTIDDSVLVSAEELEDEYQEYLAEILMEAQGVFKEKHQLHSNPKTVEQVIENAKQGVIVIDSQKETDQFIAG